MSSYILWQATSRVRFSITAVCVCAHVVLRCLCLFVIQYVWHMCECVCISKRRDSQQDLGTELCAHQDLTKRADGALWGVPPAWSPLFQSYTPAYSPLHPFTPCTAASYARALQFHQAVIPWVSRNSNTICTNKNWADQLSDMQYWRLACHSVPVTAAAVIVLN